MRLSELDATLSDPLVASDMNRYRALSREHADAAGLVDLFRRFRDARARSPQSATELLEESSAAICR